MSKKSKGNKGDLIYYEPLSSDCPTPSVFGEKRNKGPDYTKVYLKGGQGFIVGSEIESFPKNLVGIPQGKEGNILVVGANGSGKSRCIAKTTLLTWNGAMAVLDPKGELYAHYMELRKSGKVDREAILFDLTCDDGKCYDPLHGIIPGSVEEIECMKDIVRSICPTNTKCPDPFWDNAERNILFASLLHYHGEGCNFIIIITKVLLSTIKQLCKEINEGDTELAKMYIQNLSKVDSKIRASFSCGLLNALGDLVSNPYLLKAFCGDNEGSDHFGWANLEKYNIFIRVPEDKIEQWSIPIRIMFTQLFHYLMKRPDKYSDEGRKNIQTLLLLDDFARFGKIELITEAITTLRSKNVNICIMLQSLAQLDRIYGVDDRRIICDNCQFKVILSAYDGDTQKHLSELIGSTVKWKEDYTDIEDTCGSIDSTSRHHSSHRVPVIYPHEFKTLNKVLFDTPHGFYCLDKITSEDIISLQEFSIRPQEIDNNVTNYSSARILSITSRNVDSTEIASNAEMTEK